jgi:hypothetical protein
MTYRVHLEQSWAFDGSVLHVINHRGNGTLEYLNRNGVWSTVDEGLPLGDDAGIMLPREAVKALIAELAPDATAGEIGVLREALAVERDRVDRVLARMRT